MIEVRCSRCQFPAHLIFAQDWLAKPSTLPLYGWRGDPIVCPVCRRTQP